MSMTSSQLVALLDEYVDKFDTGKLDDRFKKRVQTALADESDPGVFRAIAAEVWDKYSCVDALLVISILRRWLAIEPDSMEAKRALGSYLLAHGPDWDEEGRALLAEAG